MCNGARRPVLARDDPFCLARRVWQQCGGQPVQRRREWRGSRNAAENPDADLKLVPKTATLELTAVEERAAEGKKPIEYEREPGDDKGYPVEF